MNRFYRLYSSALALAALVGPLALADRLPVDPYPRGHHMELDGLTIDGVRLVASRPDPSKQDWKIYTFEIRYQKSTAVSAKLKLLPQLPGTYVSFSGWNLQLVGLGNTNTSGWELTYTPNPTTSTFELSMFDACYRGGSPDPTAVQLFPKGGRFGERPGILMRAVGVYHLTCRDGEPALAFNHSWSVYNHMLVKSFNE